jgi:hypothetical protein
MDDWTAVDSLPEKQGLKQRSYIPDELEDRPLTLFQKNKD